MCIRDSRRDHHARADRGADVVPLLRCPADDRLPRRGSRRGAPARRASAGNRHAERRRAGPRVRDRGHHRPAGEQAREHRGRPRDGGGAEHPRPGRRQTPDGAVHPGTRADRVAAGPERRCRAGGARRRPARGRGAGGDDPDQGCRPVQHGGRGDVRASLTRHGRGRTDPSMQRASTTTPDGRQHVAHLLGGEALHLEYPTTVVFGSVTVGIGEGDRIGVVGRNGDGKSSLLALLSGRLAPDAGRVTVRSGVRIGVLDQTDTLDQTLTIAQAVVGSTPEHEWAGDPGVREVLAGLLSDLSWDAVVGDLSGGERRRVALAALLTGDDDVLFLDEPTNHLDIGCLLYLAGHLRARWAATAGGVVVVTHDRWFLDEVCTATWEVHDGVVEPFEGGYAAYVLQRVERDRMAAASEAKRANLMRKELAWLRRGPPARTAKPKFRIDAANQLIEDEPPPRNSVELARMAIARLGKDVVDLLDVSVSYGATSVLRDVTWLIGPGERTGILGVNGAGKSTLLGLVTGAVRPTRGRVKRGTTVKVATLTQELAELDDLATDRVSDVVQ